jgi:hypothetical protein
MDKSLEKAAHSNLNSQTPTQKITQSLTRLIQSVEQGEMK